MDQSDEAADHEAEGPDVGPRGGVCGLREGERGPRGEDDGFVGGAVEVFVVEFGALVVFGGVEAFGAEVDGVGRPEGADGFGGYGVGDAQVGDFEVRVERVGGLVWVEEEDVGGFDVAVDQGVPAGDAVADVGPVVAVGES